MAIVADYGPLEQRDVECDHPSNCEQSAVARVPEQDVIGGWQLCAFHLALWADTRSEEETLQELEIAALAAEDRFLQIDEAPPELDREVRYRRIGVDHRGLAHYYVVGRDDGESERVITVDGELELVDGFDVPAHVGIKGWIDHVDDRRCWVELDDDVRGEGGASA